MLSERGSRGKRLASSTRSSKTSQAEHLNPAMSQGNSSPAVVARIGCGSVQGFPLCSPHWGHSLETPALHRSVSQPAEQPGTLFGDMRATLGLGSLCVQRLEPACTGVAAMQQECKQLQITPCVGPACGRHPFCEGRSRVILSKQQSVLRGWAHFPFFPGEPPPISPCKQQQNAADPHAGGSAS